MHYIYAYLRTDGTPYYIGKGKGNRAWKKHTNIHIPKDDTYIVIMENNLTELGAFALERRYIRWWGRKDLGTGILRNRTDGGEGRSGHKHSKETRKKMSKSQQGKVMSEEHKRKISECLKGRKHTEEHNRKMRESLTGRKLSEEHKKILSKSHQGRKHTEETKNKMSVRKKGISKPKVTCPHCGKDVPIHLKYRWHYDNCKQKRT